MADNVLITPGSGDSVAADDISSVKYQRIKLTLGADGVNDGDVASGNPLPINDAGGSLTVDGTVAATQSGTWNVTNISGTVSLPTGAATAAKQPALGTAGTPSTDVITVQGRSGMTALLVDGTATTQPVSGTVTANLAAGSNLIGKVNVDAQTGNGFSMYRNTALSNSATAVKAAAGNFTGCHIYNPNSADAFVQFYDLAAGSVTVGTTTPNWTLWIPANGAVDSGFPPSTFATAITVAATTTITGSTAPSTGLLVNLQYK